MKLLVFLIFTIIQAQAMDDSILLNLKNKIGVGADSHFKYNRALEYGFYLGTDWKYRLIFEGNESIHLVQQSDIWLLTASHYLSLKIVSLENRFSFLSLDDNFQKIKFDSKIRKQFEFDKRWSITPSIILIEYVLDPTIIHQKWPFNNYANSGVFKTELALELELFF